MSIWSAIGSVGGSLLSGLFGSNSTKSTNQQNMKIAQMNNEFNERMMQKQMDYKTDMWNKQNEYNSASAQRQRLEIAGLNPYMMMNGGSAGVAQSAGGVTPAQANNVQMQAYHPDFSGITQTLTSLMDIRAMQDLRKSQSDMLDAQSAGVKIENQYKAQKLLAEIQNLKGDTFFKRSAENLNAMNYARMQAMFSSDVEKAEREAENAAIAGASMRAQTALTQMQGMLTAKELQVFDQRFLWEQALNAARQYQMVAAGKSSEAQARQAIENSLNLAVQRYGIHVDNYVKDRTKNALIKTAWQNANYVKELGKHVGKENSWYWYNHSLGPILENIVPMGIGFGLGAWKGAVNAPKHVSGFRR